MFKQKQTKAKLYLPPAIRVILERHYSENTKQWEKAAFLLQKKLKYEHLTVKQICAFWKNLKEKRKKAKRETRAYDQEDGNFGELLGWSEGEVEMRALRVLEDKEQEERWGAEEAK